MGMSLTSSGVVGGTPLEEGTFNFTAQVRDATGATAQKPFTLSVGTTATPPYDSQFVSQIVPSIAQPGQQFSVSIKWLNTGAQAWSGGGFKVRSQNPENNTTWGGNTVQVNIAPVQPAQHLDAAFTATAPLVPGTYSFQWQLFQEGTGFFGQASTSVQVVVPEPPASSPQIDSPVSMETRKGATFRHQLLATGGTPPYLWSMPTGSLPAGISLNPNTGLISGTAGAAGTFPFTVQVNDSALRASQKNITIAVSGPPPELLTVALPAFTRGVAFSFQLSATGGTAPYRWALSSGALPSGLTLGLHTGVITGTPTLSGNFGFTVDVTDADSRTARKALSITVLAPPLSIEFAESVEALKGSPFNLQINAAGGTPPYTWAISAGALPSGLALNSATGAITGSPTASGVFNVTVSVRDQASQGVSRPLQIKVIDPATIPAITKAQYKPGKKKLTVQGERIDRAAILLIDGRAVKAKHTGGALVAKKLALTDGPHEIIIVNPNNVSSQPFILHVD